MTTTDTISITKPITPPEPKNGDILQGGEFLSSLISKEEAEEMRLLPLAMASENHWEALKKIGLDPTELQEAVEYECPFRKDAKFYKIYPIAISSFQVGEVEEWYEYILKKDPDTDYFHRKPSIDDVDRSFMGHGYDRNILPSDGHGSWQYAKIKLSDERWLLVTYWEWYNK